MPGIIFSAPAGFVFDGPLAPGSGSFTDAPMWDWETSDVPAAFGGGGYDVTVDGVRYESPLAESFSARFDDGAGGDYLVVGAVRFETDAAGVEQARVIYVVTPSADFSPGAAVALDGYDRIALFGAGPADSEYAEVLAAATTGTITFLGGSLAPDGAVSAGVSGDFGKVAWEDRPPPDDPPDDPPATVAPGAYRLTVGALVEVACDGTLAGREADYGTLGAADVGFVDADVTLSGTLTVEGAALAAGFGSATLALDWDGVGYATVAEHVTPGPFGVDHTFSALGVMPVDPPGGPLPAVLAAFYDDRTGTGGWCALQWDATLSP